MQTRVQGEDRKINGHAYICRSFCGSFVSDVGEVVYFIAGENLCWSDGGGEKSFPEIKLH